MRVDHGTRIRPHAKPCSVRSPRMWGPLGPGPFVVRSSITPSSIPPGRARSHVATGAHSGSSLGLPWPRRAPCPPRHPLRRLLEGPCKQVPYRRCEAEAPHHNRPVTRLRSRRSATPTQDPLPATNDMDVPGASRRCRHPRDRPRAPQRPASLIARWLRATGLPPSCSSRAPSPQSSRSAASAHTRDRVRRQAALSAPHTPPRRPAEADRTQTSWPGMTSLQTTASVATCGNEEPSASPSPTWRSR